MEIFPNSSKSSLGDAVFFYGANKGFAYKEFSQWYRTTFTISRTCLILPCEDIRGGFPMELHFNCAEQFMMYSKAVIFEDWQMATLILASTVPKKQREYGQRVRNFDEETWIKVRELIVYTATYAKFTQDLDCREVLLSTGTRLICESSPYDRIWGIGYTKTKALLHIDDWGTNLLGKVLMAVRDQIRIENL